MQLTEKYRQSIRDKFKELADLQADAMISHLESVCVANKDASVEENAKLLDILISHTFDMLYNSNNNFNAKIKEALKNKNMEDFVNGTK